MPAPSSKPMSVPLEPDPSLELKRAAAERAVTLVTSGMVVGLGGGTTAMLAVRRLAHALREGELRDVVCVPCTDDVEQEAGRLGIALATLAERPTIDLTIDGADEVDRALRLIKGGGGALLREKIVAQASLREVIVVDESKLSLRLGTRHALPVEVAVFGWTTQQAFLERLGAQVALRRGPDGSPWRTDGGNLILDCAFGPIEGPDELADRLAARAGIVEHGLFIGLTTDLIVGSTAGVKHRRRAVEDRFAAGDT